MTSASVNSATAEKTRLLGELYELHDLRVAIKSVGTVEGLDSSAIDESIFDGTPDGTEGGGGKRWFEEDAQMTVTVIDVLEDRNGKQHKDRFRTHKPYDFWEKVRRVGHKETLFQPLGSIVCTRNPTPEAQAVLFCILEKHMHVHSIFRTWTRDYREANWVVEPPKTTAGTNSTLEISLQYLTLFDQNTRPYPWQIYQSDALGKHGPIGNYSCVISLSFNDLHLPWKLLYLSAGPTSADTDNRIEAGMPTTGFQAFLHLLRVEVVGMRLRTAAVLQALEQALNISPDALLNKRRRDQMLFEDSTFTGIRRYFWALLLLRMLSRSIIDLRRSLHEVLKLEIWDDIRTSDSLKSTSDCETNKQNHATRLDNLLDETRDELEKLETLSADVDSQYEHINVLSTKLSEGTGLLEARRGVEQAVLMIRQERQSRSTWLFSFVATLFLPLTFVTSVFGMTNIDPDLSFRPFVNTLLAVCVPVWVLACLLFIFFGTEWGEERVRSAKMRLKMIWRS